MGLPKERQRLQREGADGVLPPDLARPQLQSYILLPVPIYRKVTDKVGGFEQRTQNGDGTKVQGKVT